MTRRDPPAEHGSWNFATTREYVQSTREGREAIREFYNRSAAEGLNSRSAADEHNSRSAADEHNSRSAADEHNSRSAADEHNSRSAADEHNSRSAADEHNSRSAADEHESRRSVNEQKSRSAVDEQDVSSPRQKLRPHERGTSFGEEAAKRAHILSFGTLDDYRSDSNLDNKEDNGSKGTASTIADDDSREDIPASIEKPCVVVTREETVCVSPSYLVAGFFRQLLEFLTCASVTNICTRSNDDEEDKLLGIVVGQNAKGHNAKFDYEIPLRSVQDDDIEAWGVDNYSKEKEALQPTKFAKAINFSSKRLDKNAAIALYDEKKLRQEVHKVEIPEEYFEDPAEDEDYDDFSFSAGRKKVPEAILLKPRKVDDVSVLEDDSVYSHEDPRHVPHAWSLSPRRKRELKARARAIGKNAKE